MTIKMPQITKAICDNCRTIDEVYWGEHGSESYCQECSAPPASFSKWVA
jgi:hypothetical protein